MFFKNHTENEARILVLDLFLFFEKFYELNAVVCSLVLMYFESPQLDIQKKQKHE